MDYHVIACYGAMRHIGLFRTDIEVLRKGEQCILRTARGVEIGEAIEKTHEAEPEEQNSTVGQVLRRATPRDLERVREIEEDIAPQEQQFCVQKIGEHELPMKVASVEHLFGGDKIIFYFLAEGRVDFRALVKDLAAQYRTRIEMRQIGVRDEARLLADIEHCGRELCCRTFMKTLEPVTMRMAKSQKSTLDPSKISGRCGRLMCCLRFEDETYCYLKRQLPKKGTRVTVEAGKGEVTGYNILRQMVDVELDDRTDVTVPVADILNREDRGGSRRPRSGDDDQRGNNRQRRGGPGRDSGRASDDQDDEQEGCGGCGNCGDHQDDDSDDNDQN